jgi:hypothetical protein
MKNIIDLLRSYMKDAEVVRVRGEVSLKVYKNDTLIEDSVEKNLVVTLGRTNIAKLLGGSAGGYAVNTIKVGTNGTAPTAGDTSITSPFSKGISTVSYPTAGTVQFDFTITTSEANGMSIAEFGLFDSNGTMFARKNRTSAIAKDNTIAVAGTWKIIF